MVINLKYTTIILNLDALSENINYYYQKYNKKIMAVVKNNAYGHGLKEISLFLDKDDRVQYLVVNTIKEGIYLRKIKIKKPILILGNIEPKDYEKTIKYNLTLSINSLKIYYELIDRKYMGKVHLNINTGMNRLGITNYNFLDRITNSSLNIEGIYTHYKGDINDAFSIKKQQEIFINFIKNIDYSKYIIHDVSSTNVDILDLSYTSSLRIGLGLYGLNNTTKPMLSLVSPIINIMKIKKNDSVSYHSSFIAPKDGYIITIPFGYGDGWYKNIEILNKELLQAGNMTMNYTMFFTDKYPKTKEIEIIGNHNKILNMSLIYKISPYEIITKLSPFLIRKVNQK